MTEPAREHWLRAIEALGSAELNHRHGFFNDAGSRAYYAAFRAVSALFAREGASFSKHSAVEAAVHRDLVHTGRWSHDLGQAYRRLRELREIGDYGEPATVDEEAVRKSLAAARRILEAVRRDLSAEFPGLPEEPAR